MDSREQLITPLEKIVEIRANVVCSLKDILDTAFGRSVLAGIGLVTEDKEKNATLAALKTLIDGQIDKSASENDVLTNSINEAFNQFYPKKSENKAPLADKFVEIMRQLTALRSFTATSNLDDIAVVILKLSLIEIENFHVKLSAFLTSEDKKQIIANNFLIFIDKLMSALKTDQKDAGQARLHFLLDFFNLPHDGESLLIDRIPSHYQGVVIGFVESVLDSHQKKLFEQAKADSSQPTMDKLRDAATRLLDFQATIETKKKKAAEILEKYKNTLVPVEESKKLEKSPSRSKGRRALLDSQFSNEPLTVSSYEKKVADPIPSTPSEPKPSTPSMPTTEQKADSKTPEMASIKRLHTNSEPEPKQEPAVPPSPMTQLLQEDQEPEEVKDIKEIKGVKKFNKTKLLKIFEAHKEQLKENLRATLKKDSIPQELKNMFAHDLIINTYRLEQIEKLPNLFDPDQECLHLEMQAIHQLEKLQQHFDTFPKKEKFPTINSLPNDLDPKEQKKYAEGLKNYANQQIKIIEHALKEIKAREEEIRKKRAEEAARQAEAEEEKKENESKRESTSGGNAITPKPESNTPRRNPSIVIPEVISQPIPHKKLGFWKRHPTLATLGKIVVGAIAFGLIGALVYAVGPAIAVGTGIIGIGAAVGAAATVLYLGLKKLYNYCKPKKVAPETNMDQYPLDNPIEERQSEEFVPTERTENSPPERTLSGGIISPRSVPLPTPRKHVSIESKKTDDELLYQKLVELFYPGNPVPTDQDKIDRLKLLNYYEAEFKCKAKDRFVIKESEVGGDPDNQASFKIPDLIFRLSQSIYENNQRILTQHPEPKTATQMLEFLSKNLKLYYSDYAINSSPLSVHSSLARPTLLNNIYNLLINDNMPTTTKIQALDSLLRRIKLSPNYRVDIQYSNFVTKPDVDILSSTPQ